MKTRPQIMGNIGTIENKIFNVIFYCYYYFSIEVKTSVSYLYSLLFEIDSSYDMQIYVGM